MINLTDWEHSGKYIDYRGHRIFTRSAGEASAPVLLLIHGFPTASWDWEAVWRPLAKHFRVLALDMIGFGFSAKPLAYAYSILDQADLFEQFLREQEVEHYHVLAHDYGDTVAQELLARQDEAGERPRLHSVCFLNGGLFPETHRPLFMQKLLLSPLGGMVARLTTKTRFSDAMRSVFRRPPGQAVLDNFWTLLTHNDGIAVMPKLIHYMTERRQHRERWVTALIRSTVPLKVIDGALDPVSGAHMVERYRELIPKPNTTLLEGVGHYPQVEAPEEVLEAYQTFLQRHTLVEFLPG
jgi:pimeloyl-ACP methyl ester carboxylesterase